MREIRMQAAAGGSITGSGDYKADDVESIAASLASFGMAVEEAQAKAAQLSALFMDPPREAIETGRWGVAIHVGDSVVAFWDYDRPHTDHGRLYDCSALV